MNLILCLTLKYTNHVVCYLQGFPRSCVEWSLHKSMQLQGQLGAEVYHVHLPFTKLCSVASGHVEFSVETPRFAAPQRGMLIHPQKSGELVESWIVYHLEYLLGNPLFKWIALINDHH